MKKLIALLLAVAMVACLFVGCGKETNEPEEPTTTAPENVDNNEETPAPAPAVALKVAMVTDYGDITDQSFNQTTYEAGKAWCEANNVEFSYFKPTNDSLEARVASIELAIEQGYNTLLLPGYAFGGAIAETAAQNPEVYYIALDVSAADLGEGYEVPANVYCAVYQEELSGFMAGVAAVKLGYTELGFLGGIAVPAVMRFGYGFVQGADYAAGLTGAKVNVKYCYGNQFFGDADITAYMDTWYNEGTQVVFACGGGIYASAAEAAVKVNGKVIGVDVDQKGIIDGTYKEGLTVTSAMKGLGATVKATLTGLAAGNWADYSTKVETLGLVSGTDLEANYVQLPTTTQFGEGFTAEDYAALVADMFAGTITVSSSIDAEPAVANITVDYQGNIK